MSEVVKKEVKALEMVALKQGYYQDKLIEKGEHFVFSGIPGKWMKPAKESSAEEKAQAAAEAKAQAEAEEKAKAQADEEAKFAAGVQASSGKKKG